MGKLQKFEAVLDTVFDGYLSINQDLANLLGLHPTKKVKTINPDNQEVLNNVYELLVTVGTLDLNFVDYRIFVIGKQNQRDELIIGQAMLDRFCQDNKLVLVLDYNNSTIYFEG